MVAAVIEQKNAPVVIKEVPTPKPGPGEVVVRVHAAALNHRDIWIQKGQYAGLRYPIIVGSDGAGTVAQLGEGVDPGLLHQEVLIQPGQHWGDTERAQSKEFKILGLPDDGTLGEYVKVLVCNLVLKPGHLSFEEAAPLPLGGLTAYRALFKRAGLLPQENLLITGIGGGVAMLGLQLALALGAKVYVTSSDPGKIGQALEMGAAGGALYTEQDWAKTFAAEVGPFDVILDSAGGAGFSELLDLATPGGRIAVYGATQGNVPELALRKVFWKQLSILGSTMGSDQDFADLIAFVAHHQIRPVIDQVFPLAQTEEAFQRMSQGKQTGKIVIRMV